MNSKLYVFQIRNVKRHTGLTGGLKVYVKVIDERHQEAIFFPFKVHGYF